MSDTGGKSAGISVPEIGKRAKKAALFKGPLKISL